MPRYSESAARAAIAASTNWSQALRLLGLRAASGNHAVLKRWATDWGAYEQLLADLREMSWVAVGAKYGVSDNAVREWMRRYEAEQPAAASG